MFKFCRSYSRPAGVDNAPIYSLTAVKYRRRRGVEGEKEEVLLLRVLVLY